MWNVLIEPWRWRDSLEMFWPIVVQGSIVAVALGLVGCFLVVRGVSLLGDALSHSVLPGIVIGFLISAALGSASLHSPWILAGATGVGLAAALLVEAVQKHSRVKEDASLGIVFTTLFALGVVMINLYAGQTDLDPGCVLYGDIVNYVQDQSGMIPMAVILGGIIVGLLLFYRQLLVSTFDPALAVSLGIPAHAIHYVLMAVLSLTIVASFEAVGAILAVALLILPGATARLWTDRMPWMLLLAGAHGVASAALGYWLSHPAVLKTSPSGAMCTAGFVLFLLSWLFAPRHGLLVQLWVRRRLRRAMALENLLKAVEEAGGGGGQSVSAAAVAGALRLPPGAFERALRRGERTGWLRPRGDAIELTDAGRQRSRRLVRAHELWEQYLMREVGLPADHVHDAAEWVEHHLDGKRLEALEQELGIAEKEATRSS